MTHYRYALTLSRVLPTPDQAPFPKFTTFPEEGKPVSFSFAFGSCFLPEDENGGRIFYAIDRHRQQNDLRFFLMIGDQIYADAFEKNGIGKIATDLEDYRDVYAYTWSRPQLRRLLSNLPVFMSLDDHEVDDDWTWIDPRRRRAQIPIWDRLARWLRGRPVEERRLPLHRVRGALQAYWEHQGMHAATYITLPNLDDKGQYILSHGEAGSLAYTFRYGGAAFFVLDTRTMRVKGRQGRTMLGEGQWQALEAWLMEVKDTCPVKFLVTSCSFLFDMWIDFARDRWSGFPAERERLLQFLATNEIRGVHLLSGDLHFANAVYAELDGPKGRAIPLWEFCSTPFEQQSMWLASRTYRRVSSKWVKNQQLLFTLDQYNFGVVRVDFKDLGEPRVGFEVYDRDGDLLKKVGG